MPERWPSQQLRVGLAQAIAAQRGAEFDVGFRTGPATIEPTQAKAGGASQNRGQAREVPIGVFSQLSVEKRARDRGEGEACWEGSCEASVPRRTAMCVKVGRGGGGRRRGANANRRAGRRRFGGHKWQNWESGERKRSGRFLADAPGESGGMPGDAGGAGARGCGAAREVARRTGRNSDVGPAGCILGVGERWVGPRNRDWGRGLAGGVFRAFCGKSGEREAGPRCRAREPPKPPLKKGGGQTRWESPFQLLSERVKTGLSAFSADVLGRSADHRVSGGRAGVSSAGGVRVHGGEARGCPCVRCHDVWTRAGVAVFFVRRGGGDGPAAGGPIGGVVGPARLGGVRGWRGPVCRQLAREDRAKRNPACDKTSRVQTDRRNGQSGNWARAACRQPKRTGTGRGVGEGGERVNYFFSGEGIREVKP